MRSHFLTLLLLVLSPLTVLSAAEVAEEKSQPARSTETEAQSDPANGEQDEGLVNTAALEEIPPIDTSGWPESPSKAPGTYIWDDPRLTHWPGIIYRSEERNVAFMIHNRFSKKGQLVDGSIGWPPGEQRKFTLPAQEDALRVSGLTPLPKTPGQHSALLQIGEEQFDLKLRIVDVKDAWPMASLKNGFPVDADGHPVVLRIERPESQAGKNSGLLDTFGKRPSGKAVLLGDPLAALGSDSWEGVDARRVEATDQRYPHYAVLVAMAQLEEPYPKTLIYSPGNQALFARSWTAEEERVLQAIEQRWQILGVMPELVLALPPVPVQGYLQKQAKERRELLRRSAVFRGWSILDVEEVAGPATEANKVSEGAYTNYPIGDARIRLRDAFNKILER